MFNSLIAPFPPRHLQDICGLFAGSELLSREQLPWRLGTNELSPLESWEIKLCRHVRSFSFSAAILESFVAK